MLISNKIGPKEPTRLVNVFNYFGLIHTKNYSITPKKGLQLSDNDIIACLHAGASVEEVLANGKTMSLTLEDFFNAPVIEKVEPVVVNIEEKTVEKQEKNELFDDSDKEIIEDIPEKVEQDKVEEVKEEPAVEEPKEEVKKEKTEQEKPAKRKTLLDQIISNKKKKN